MGLARIAIAVLAVVLALGLLVLGGVALWGALTRDSTKQPTPSPTPSPVKTSKVRGGKKGGGHAAPSGGAISNRVEIQCLVSQCQVYVAGPGANDVQFNGKLFRNEHRIFNETRLTVAVDDSSTVTVIINGRVQPKGRPGEAKTYQVPAR